MKLWGVLADAVRGWGKILRGDPDWQEAFRLTPAGLVTALLLYAVAALFGIILASASYGMPSLPAVLAGMVVLSFPVLSLTLSLLGTRAALHSDQPLLPILVPGTYAAIAFFFLEGLLASIGGPIVMVSWAAFGFLLYRLARISTEWSLGVAAAFAVLSVGLLVGTRIALYMLSNPSGSPI
jgi:hypothetical protein